MTNIARARRILDAMTGRWGKPATTRDAAQALADAGLLAPEPQIIRTRDELAALDPDTLVGNFDDYLGGPLKLSDRGGPLPPWAEIYLPLAVIATGEQVRAARQALEAADAVD